MDQGECAKAGDCMGDLRIQDPGGAAKPWGVVFAVCKEHKKLKVFLAEVPCDQTDVYIYSKCGLTAEQMGLPADKAPCTTVIDYQGNGIRGGNDAAYFKHMHSRYGELNKLTLFMKDTFRGLKWGWENLPLIDNLGFQSLEKRAQRGAPAYYTMVTWADATGSYNCFGQRHIAKSVSMAVRKEEAELTTAAPRPPGA